MALVLLDRAQESATANTTVSFTLNGAQTGYQSLAGVGDTNTTYYGATDGTNWEVGIGTYSITGPTLTRTTILSSSNAGSAVTFASGAGAVTVFIDYPSSKSVYQTGAFQGTIDNTVIGATTPAAGTFTTITGQTEVLKGTGQNLFTQSQTFSTWTGTGYVLTPSNATDPLGTTTASTLAADGATSAHTMQFNINSLNITATVSVYAKAGTNNFLQIRLGTDATPYANFNLSTGVLGTSAGGTATITASTNGFYRCTFTFTSATSTAVAFNIVSSASATRNESNSLATNVILWGAQLEIGSVTNTYIPTTTTAVYGTPTLSFSGVAGLGLQSDGSLYVSPAGTGALQAQATTSTTAGGNARGANAVDWQTIRGNANQVASSAYSVLGGGNQNRSAGFGSTVAGGEYCVATTTDAVVVGGNSNQATGSRSAVVGGNQNLATGYYNFIGGGQSNSGTANAAVTTQSGTMNGTTAVTLSGSNASIKVGQFINGTSISDNTYVAAISGTALTLSQAASGSSTSTLSFYTPHGVVVGGGNNQATGSYSFIGGGGDAGTAANRNVASGDWSTVCGGIFNQATGQGAFIGGGGALSGLAYNNIASGNGSVIGGGYANQATAQGSVSIGGYNNLSTGTYSSLLGGSFGTSRSIVGNLVSSACQTPVASNNGINQSALLILARQTTDATPTVLASNSSAAGTTNQVILPNNSAYYVRGSIVAGVTGGGDSSSWTFQGTIKRGANAAATSLVAAITATLVSQDTGAALWGGVTITADTTNGGLAVTVTGKASTTIRWVCKVETTEMTY